jgi:hypothetical protein
MKRILVTLSLLAAIQIVSGQEQLPRREALKLAFYVSADLKTLQSTPITTDVDLKQPVAVRDGDYGALVLPEAKLNDKAITKSGEHVVSVGQLWLYRLTPMRDGVAVPGSQLRTVNVETDGNSAAVVQCALGAESNGSGGVELLLYGKDKSPLLKLPLKKIEGPQQPPIAMNAERTDDTGLITLKILGRYQATFDVTELED